MHTAKRPTEYETRRPRIILDHRVRKVIVRVRVISRCRLDRFPAIMKYLPNCKDCKEKTDKLSQASS